MPLVEDTPGICPYTEKRSNVEEFASKIRTDLSGHVLELHIGNDVECVRPLFEALEWNKSFKSLVLRRESELPKTCIGSCFQWLNAVLKVNTCLNELNILGFPLTLEEIKGLAAIISWNKALRSLSLYLCDESVPLFVQSLANNYSLHSLRITGNNLSVTSIKAILAALKTNYSLIETYIEAESSEKININEELHPILLRNKRFAGSMLQYNRLLTLLDEYQTEKYEKLKTRKQEHILNLLQKIARFKPLQEEGLLRKILEEKINWQTVNAKMLTSCQKIMNNNANVIIPTISKEPSFEIAHLLSMIASLTSMTLDKNHFYSLFNETEKSVEFTLPLSRGLNEYLDKLSGCSYRTKLNDNNKYIIIADKNDLLSLTHYYTEDLRLRMVMDLYRLYNPNVSSHVERFADFLGAGYLYYLYDKQIERLSAHISLFSLPTKAGFHFDYIFSVFYPKTISLIRFLERVTDDQSKHVIDEILTEFNNNPLLHKLFDDFLESADVSIYEWKIIKRQIMTVFTALRTGSKFDYLPAFYNISDEKTKEKLREKIVNIPFGTSIDSLSLEYFDLDQLTLEVFFEKEIFESKLPQKNTRYLFEVSNPVLEETAKLLQHLTRTFHPSRDEIKGRITASSDEFAGVISNIKSFIEKWMKIEIAFKELQTFAFRAKPESLAKTLEKCAELSRLVGDYYTTKKISDMEKYGDFSKIDEQVAIFNKEIIEIKQKAKLADKALKQLTKFSNKLANAENIERINYVRNGYFWKKHKLDEKVTTSTHNEVNDFLINIIQESIPMHEAELAALKLKEAAYEALVSCSFSDHLAKICKKLNQYKNESHKYRFHTDLLDQIYKDLVEKRKRLLQGELVAHQFKDQCMGILRTNMNKLDTHRGWLELFTDFLNALLNIGSLGISYKITERWRVFPRPSTKSAKIATDFINSLACITPSDKYQG